MQIDQALLNSWDKAQWIEKKRKLSDCVWCEGALLEHTDSDKIFLAPEPTEFGVVYEIALHDLVEVVATGRTKQKLDRSYTISRAYLKKYAVVIRQQWMLATELPEDAHALSVAAVALAQQTTSPSLLDLSITRATKFTANGEAEPSPSPSPSPTPEPKPPRGGGGGIGVSGVRG